jgi:hypothetical protein
MSLKKASQKKAILGFFEPLFDQNADFCPLKPSKDLSGKGNFGVFWTPF